MNRPLYTIGYEGARIEDFVRTLLDAGVTTLLDVREVPISRKKGFSKSTLKDAVEAHGIRYLHLRGLGDPKPGRLAARAGNYDLFQRIFTQHMQTPEAQTELHIARTLALENIVCLMCFERDHCGCHRSIVARHLVPKTGLAIHNLAVEAKPVSHALPFTPAYARA